MSEVMSDSGSITRGGAGGMTGVGASGTFEASRSTLSLLAALCIDGVGVEPTDIDSIDDSGLSEAIDSAGLTCIDGSGLTSRRGHRSLCN